MQPTHSAIRRQALGGRGELVVDRAIEVLGEGATTTTLTILPSSRQHLDPKVLKDYEIKMKAIFDDVFGSGVLDGESEPFGVACGRSSFRCSKRA